MSRASAASSLVPVPTDVLLLVLTAALAIVAAGAAVVSVRSAHRRPTTDPAASRVESPRQAVLVPFTDGDRPSERLGVLAPREVDDRIVVPPTQAQVVNTALGRPQVRMAVVARGLAFALRAESRDRIVALIRREYRRRRAERLRAGRRAVRAARPAGVPGLGRQTSTASADAWMEQPWTGEIEAGAGPSERSES